MSSCAVEIVSVIICSLLNGDSQRDGSSTCLLCQAIVLYMQVDLQVKVRVEVFLIVL